MSTLSRDEIGNFAKNAGFTGENVNIAIAVAMAESGGNPDAHNTTPPDDSYGLWQINMYGSLGPGRRKALNIAKDSELFNPAVNARGAKMVFDGQGWNGWTTFKTGAYKKFLDGGGGGGGGSVVSDITGFSAIASSVNAFGQTLFNGLASVVAVLVAITLLVAGVVILARKHIPVKKVAKTAVKAVV